MKFNTVKELDNKQFRRLTGVKRVTFDKMVCILADGIKNRRNTKGRKKKLGIEDMLLMNVEYIREYRTYFDLSQSYGIRESSNYKTVKWVEDTLIKHPDFALPGRKALLKRDMEYELVLIDATETPIERPKKQFYSEKKKKHTLKTQLIVDKKSQRIICTAFANGKRHDFRLFKESKTLIHQGLECGLILDTRVYKRFMLRRKCRKRRAKDTP